MKRLTAILMVVFLSVGITVLLTSCKEKTDQPVEPASSERDMATMPEKAQDTAEAVVDQAKEMVIEQETCPVMGNPINKDVFIEYEGKKVYFCCPGCEETFLKDPEKYISKLPQFQD